MKSRTCPKGGGNDIRSDRQVRGKKGAFASNTIRIDALTTVLGGPATLDNYLCVDCGYVESCLGEQSAVELIRSKWPRVGEQATG